MTEASAIVNTRRCPRRRIGTTLIEVLAGLVVLGTLLVSVTMARARFLHQWSDADRRLVAIHAADAMISGWIAGPPQSIPLRSEGVLEKASDLRWRTSVIRDPQAASLGALVVRTEVFEIGRASCRERV